MKIQRLAWAGIKISTQNLNLVIDAWADVSGVRKFMGEPSGNIISARIIGSVNVALITHLHPDHYDPKTLKACLERQGQVLCHHAIRQKVESDGLGVTSVELNETVSIHDLKITAVPAVDGLGDHQVSWIVESDGSRIIHCGDTLWHGYWWRIAKRYGPFDIAFLPINGAVVEFPGLVPSSIPASLTPKQAVAAAAILDANVVCPIHYRAFNNPPVYAEFPDAEDTLIEAAKECNLPVKLIEPGEVVQA